MPYVDNEGTSKKYIPMTEFFDIEVTENLKTGLNNKKQVENLFITRNLVKFRFSIDAAPGTTPFKVTAIKFNSLMQEEYLFLHGKYSPLKEEGDINTKRQITEFEIPGYAGKNICPYIFRPGNFGFNGASENLGYQAAYMPSLYFCETKRLTLTPGEDNKPDFSVGIEVEYPFTEEVVDKDGKPVLGEDGNPMTQPVTNQFEAKTLGNLPFFIPRNTIVDVKMTLSNGELSAVATVYPYTAVSLNPEFGFSRPSTDRLSVAPTMDLPMNKKGLLYAYYTPTPAYIPPTEENQHPNQFKLIWVVSPDSEITDPEISYKEIIALEPISNDNYDPTDLLYVQPSESIELQYLYDDGRTSENGGSVPVRIVPKATGTAYVYVYSQTGLVARCKVTVTEPVTE